ncbi:MAG: putative glycolipid-binding domain-containing protein [Dehalococcoidia bacterium]
MSGDLHRTVLWLALHAPGAEHVEIRQCPWGYWIDSRMAGVEEGLPVRASYRIDVDAAWSVIGVAAMWSMAGATHRLRLRRSASGEWRDANGPRPDLAGCVDIDIAWTPLTNSLPVRRLGFAVGDRRTIPVAYIAPPDLAVTAVRQQYTRLAPDRWRYEGYPPGFVADITVDGDGLVVNYPNLFQAVATWKGGA